MTKLWYNISQNDLKVINQVTELSAAIRPNGQIATTSSIFYYLLFLCIIYLQSAVHVDTALQVHKRPPRGIQLHSGTQIRYSLQQHYGLTIVVLLQVSCFLFDFIALKSNTF